MGFNAPERASHPRVHHGRLSAYWGKMKNLRRAGFQAGLLALATSGTLAAAAAANLYLSKKAERRDAPAGKFIEIQGVRLHYVAKGDGPAVVFLHGNGSMIADFECSGILDVAAARFRVIAFDRPGYGHSSRPRNRAWTPEQQAALIAEALTQLDVQDAIIVGHSWGTLVASALAVHHPGKVKGLVLASGYYFPTPRPDVVLASAGALPGVGAILCHTILPFIGRLAWPALIRNLFDPRGVPAKFRGFSKEMALRPSQLQASAQESALMVPSTEGLAEACRPLAIPVALICGAGDQVVDPQQSAKFHQVLKSSTLTNLLFNGHMVHHTALKQVTAAIEDVERGSQVDGNMNARAL